MSAFQNALQKVYAQLTSCNPGRLGIVAIFNTGYQLAAVLERVPPHESRLASPTLGCTKTSGGKTQSSQELKLQRTQMPLAMASP
jgi:hypothetical protein